MKTMLISEILPPRTGGSGRWFWEIYRRLPREQFVVVAGDCPEADAFDRTHSVPIERVPLSLPAWGVRSWRGLCDYSRAVFKLRRLIRQHAVTRIHCGRMLPEGWMAWLLNRVWRLPYTCYVHGEETNYGVQSRELGWMMRRVLDGAERVIANSENTAGILRTNWQVPIAKIQVLHPGVDIEMFRPAPRDSKLRSQLGWDARPVILTVGRLQQRKGHDQLISALTEIRQSFPDVLYAIVGTGERRAYLEDLVRRLGVAEHVHFHDEVPDALLVGCYQQCDLFVLPNREIDGDIEGFGMVLLEAQACGQAVVAGASGGTAETMQPGVTGEIVPCDTPTELARTVCLLLSDSQRRSAMGNAARRWTVEQFGWESLSEQARAIFCAGDATTGTANCRNAGKARSAKHEATV